MQDLRILFLEDLPADYELNVNTLKKSGLDFIHKSVNNRDEFIKALISYKPHIVISDYSLPQYDGISALNDLRMINVDIPLIIVTGTLDEETAADTIKKGAWDYVVKERLHRLPSAVKNALALREEIKKKREAEEALEAAESEFESLRNNVPLAVYRSTVQGKLIYANPAFLEMFGFESISEALKVSIPDYYVRPGEREGLMNELLSKGLVKNYEIELKKKNGESFWGLFNIRAVFNKNGDHVYQDGIISDITEIKKAREELIAAKEKAEESDRLKTAFLANMSHEIRTPMNAIVGFSDLLLDPSYSTEQMAEFVHTIQSSSETLLRIINDILDVAKIESGILTIEKRPFLLNRMLKDVYQTFEAGYDNSNIEFKLLLSHPESDIRIAGDETRIKQILNNLLVNSFKFTNKGKIEIGYLFRDNEVEFFVTDTGIGIPQDKQSIIFEMFRQVDESHTREFGGTGLGLTIARTLIEKLGGEMWLVSEPGKGSDFRFTIPLDDETVREHAEPVIDERPGKGWDDWSGKTVLIAEDVESNFEYLETILKKTNVNILWARDGHEAVNYCKENQDLDLVLMDIRMPVLNGYDATKKIKEIRKDLPVVIQTAYALESDLEKIRQLDCEDIITKPISPKQLISKVGKFLNL